MQSQRLLTVLRGYIILGNIIPAHRLRPGSPESFCHVTLLRRGNAVGPQVEHFFVASFSALKLISRELFAGTTLCSKSTVPASPVTVRARCIASWLTGSLLYAILIAAAGLLALLLISAKTAGVTQVAGQR